MSYLVWLWRKFISKQNYTQSINKKKKMQTPATFKKKNLKFALKKGFLFLNGIVWGNYNIEVNYFIFNLIGETIDSIFPTNTYFHINWKIEKKRKPYLFAPNYAITTMRIYQS